jgi:hypothetical protein
MSGGRVLVMIPLGGILLGELDGFGIAQDVLAPRTDGVVPAE